jgi:HlyD family secretion protein
MTQISRARNAGKRGLVALAIGGVLALTYWAFRPQPLLVEVAPVVLGRFEQTLQEDGRLRLKQRYAVTAPQAGHLVRPTLQVGDAVNAGDVVAVLTPSAPALVDARTEAVLTQRVGVAEATAGAAAAQVERLRTAQAQAAAELQRARGLAQDQFVAPAALNQAEWAEQAARLALQAAQAQLQAANFAWAEARAALRPPSAETPVGPATLRVPSPATGRVVKLHMGSAGHVAAGQPLLEVGDTAALEAVIDVLSTEVGQITPGAVVTLGLGPHLPASPGHVLRVEPVAFTKVSALGVQEQRVQVVVALDATSPNASPLGDGYQVDARISLWSEDNVLLVPTAALARDGQGWRVFVLEHGRAQARAVQVAHRNAQHTWVQSGVREGEQVLLYPGPTLVDGQAVQVRDTQAAR